MRDFRTDFWFSQQTLEIRSMNLNSYAFTVYKRKGYVFGGNIFTIPHKIMHSILLVLILQFLFTFANGQGPRSVSSKVKFSVREEQPVGTLVGNVSVLPGLNYQFRPSTNLFTIDSRTGEIRTLTIIDREALPSGDSFDLFVTNFPENTHLFEIDLQILDINDNSPEFPSPVTEVSFSENEVPGGSMKILDTATDRDIVSNGITNRYEIVSGNEENKFQLVMLNDTSTLVYLSQLVPLDREERSSYRLNISAQDGGNPPRFGYLTVNIIIRDFNDNAPLFDESEYHVEVNETLPEGSSIIRVNAVDLDAPENSEITYEISASERDQFWIDPRTGVISALKKLDCNDGCPAGTNASYCLGNIRSCIINVKAIDNGRPPLEGNAYVTVQLIDENDHAPVIVIVASNPYTVNEGEDVNVIIEVNDNDEGSNGEVTVRISGGNERGHAVLARLSPNIYHISMDASRLDREKISMYNLTIEARDRGEPSKITTENLIIIVNDVNDYTPQFVQSTYRSEVSELLPVGSFVASVTAFDNDTGINADITYSITAGNGNGWFDINSKTGLITSRRRLGYGQLTLEIRAEDGASLPKRSRTNLSVVIYDENSEVPTFDASIYRRSIVEGADSVNREVIILTAVDNDLGVNGTVTYSFHPDVAVHYPGFFALGSANGRISTLKVVDREEFSEFNLRVIARDGGNPRLSSTATVIVTVDDINDNVPVFYPLRYYVEVREFQPAVNILQLSCTDRDSGDFARLTYSIVSRDPGKFTIQPQSGVVSTMGTLIKAEVSMYSLQVRAVDGGGSATDADVVVYVVSSTDQPRSFLQPQYTFPITEDDELIAPVTGRAVGNVAVSSNVISNPEYRIVSGDPRNQFIVNSNSGQISTGPRGIDREDADVYVLGIIAVNTTAFASTTVTVNVQDVNDHRPSYVYSVVNVNVAESAPMGYPVYLAQALDPDTQNNARITYTIAGGSSTFAIDASTGLISLSRSLSSVTEREFQLVVSAVDSGHQSQQARQTVNIIVTDVNDNTPMFEQTNHVLTLAEDMPVNEIVSTLTAGDADQGINAVVSYTIESGNVGNYFGLFPNGDLYIAKPLDRESQDLIVLRVRATDRGTPSRTTWTHVTITVTDANDNDPHFTNDTFMFHLVEENEYGAFVGVLAATDLDINQNGELSFFIDGDSHGFSVDAKSGVVTSGAKFDREQLIDNVGSSDVLFNVRVTDGGAASKSNLATVIVRIDDANDNAPVFTKEVYSDEVLEDANVGTIVVEVEASDLDIGMNAAIRYSIIEGNNESIFIMNEEIGQIALTSQIDRESRDFYMLVVQAIDRGTPRQSSTAIVELRVLDANDNAPQFVTTQREFLVPENVLRGYSVTQFSTTDDDIDANAFLVYTLTGSNSFTIDSRTGRLSLASFLDYEVQRSFDLTVTVADSGSPSRSVTMDVTVRVTDVNDRSPVFRPIPVGEVSENSRIGTRILGVTATDVDEDSELSYEITQQNPAGAHFHIDSRTGNITTAAAIDRELIATFQLTVVVYDAPSTAARRNSAETVVNIAVSDVNDNSPDFVSQKYAFIQQGIAVNSTFAVARATDKDTGSSGIVRYVMLNGGDSKFRVDENSGELFLKNALQPNVYFYDITIQAVDGGNRIAYQTMTIFVQEAEPSGAQFTNTPYRVEINEGFEGPVLTVTAEYPPPVSSSQLQYFITSVTAQDGNRVEQHLFEIPSGSTIRTVRPIDREAGLERLTIEVFVVDRGSAQPRTRATQIEVVVLDLNDSPPRFSQPLYPASVPEDVTSGHVVLRMLAEDPDVVGTLSYELVGGGDQRFAVDSQTGVLTVVGELDREQQPSYTLTVSASDGVQSSATKVKVTVTDVNDERPAFTEKAYYFDVPEDTETGATVGQVTALDGDEGVNATVTYSLLSHWGQDRFLLDRRTGQLQLLKQLDYEQTEHYLLTIQAQDSGPYRQSATVTTVINVIDRNDNAPIFDHTSYQVELFENQTVGASIMTVAASDRDSGENGAVRYYLRGGDLRNAFRMDSQTGVLSLAGSVDRESQARYNLAVEARDRPGAGTEEAGSLSGAALITVTIRDVNDNVPVFDMASVVSVRENSPPNTTVTMLHATDVDEGAGGAVRYSLQSNPNGLFSVNAETGRLVLEGHVDREAQDEHTVVVMATDMGAPALSGRFELRVRVEDTNDFAPSFESDLYEATATEDIALGTSLLTVAATDRDIGMNAELRYTIADGDGYHYFALDPITGELRVAYRLDYKLFPRHELQIEVHDLGLPESLSDTTTVVITVEDVNDCTPVFINTPYAAQVMENSAAGTTVPLLRVTAMDNDQNQNGRVAYSVIGGDRDVFSIDSATGALSVMQSLDREQRDSYRIVVQASDQGAPRRSSSATVLVSVADENDHTPLFEHAHYRGVVLENLAPPVTVATLSTTDEDEGLNAMISYSLLDNGGGRFRINATTGEISTTAHLDREQRALYTLTAQAQDGGLRMRSSQVQVSVQVLDANDNQPVFERSSYEFYIKDPTPAGHLVAAVTAVDADAGLNGQVKYTLAGSVPAGLSLALDGATGVITAAAPLNRTRNGGQRQYNLTVRAADKSPDAFSRNATVYVYFMENPVQDFPTIEISASSSGISETIDLNYPIATISSTSTRPRNQLSHHIVGGNIDDTFMIENQQVRLKKSPDYEKTQSFRLWIEVRDSGSDLSTAPLSMYREIVIPIRDANDNPPVFDDVYYNATVEENLNPPVFVTEVTASDADSENDGRVTYSLVGGASLPFSVDANTGRIATTARLDREQIDKYHLVISAVDNGSPQNSATATVDVRVLDRNDNRPLFTDIFAVQIPENAGIGAEVVKITTTDADLPGTAPVYNITQNPGGRFAIDSRTGVITVVGPLDRERNSSYTLRISANDNTFNAETRVTVDILDINDLAPQFESTSYEFSVAEEQQSGTVLGTVRATDGDETGENSEVFYYLKTPSHWFNVDSVSGLVSLRNPVTFSTQIDARNRREMVVVASDRGVPMLTSEATVVVDVRPANRHPPVFSASEYRFHITDNMPINASVGQIYATDEDMGTNGVQFMAQSGDGRNLFAVHPTTGEVTTRSSVLGLRNQTFTLVVRTQDGGLPVREAEVRVRITIEETNVYSPSFSGNSNGVVIAEDSSVGSVIASVTATDRDSGINGQIRLAIINGDPESQFAIDEVTGRVQVAKPLDYEVRNSYGLVIQARDSAPSPRSATRVLSVTVTDLNDYPPTFASSTIEAYITENSPINNLVIRAQAFDLDAPQNAVIHYTIVSSTLPSRAFTIGRTTGEIRTATEIDYEQQTDFTFLVRAENPNTPLFSNVTVHVNVVGVNEFAPVFRPANFTFDVNESASPNYEVGTVRATDADHGIDGEVRYYFVEDSNSEGFSIEAETGTIRVMETIDREAQSQIVLRVLAKNSGPIHGDDFAIAEVRISVGDANDPPRFQSSMYLASISESAQVDSSVVRVRADDSDLNENFRQVRYAIAAGNEGGAFKIDTTSGLISVQRRLDRETIDSYSLRVEATDSGSPPQTGSTTVVMTVLDANDNPPYFRPSVPVGKVTEGSTSPRPVAINLTEYTFDNDINPNQGPYEYRLLTHTNIFEVELRTGLVRPRTSLNREDNPGYLLQVQVRDAGTPTMTATLTFSLAVTDVNDNPPTAEALSILVFAFNGRVMNRKIADVHPRDSDLVGDYSCRLVQNSVNSEFTIPEACDLHANISTMETRNIRVNGNDGVHSDVQYGVSLDFESFNQATINNSIMLRLSDTDSESFIGQKYNTLLSAINSRLGGATAVMFGVNDQSPNVDVFIAARLGVNQYIAPSTLRQQLRQSESALENEAGLSIDVDYNPCADSPCLNGGRCSFNIKKEDEFENLQAGTVIFSAPYTHLEIECQCSDDYTGPRCEEPRNRCQQNPCANGGTCSSLGESLFSCSCTRGWQGTTCQEDINECLAFSPCLNGGTCENRQGSYGCRCPATHTGTNCDTQNTSCGNPSPCHNGATCVVTRTSFRCICAFGYRGTFCDVAPMGFATGAFISYPKRLNQDRNTINFELATVSRNALLFYYAKSGYQFLAVEIIEGRVRFSFALGSNILQTVRVTDPIYVSDGSWYAVQIERSSNTGSVKVSACPENQTHCDTCQDGDPRCHVTNTEGQFQLLDSSDRPLYVGGVDTVATLVAYPGQISTYEFVGCIRQLQVENTFLTTMNENRGILQGCPRVEDVCTDGGENVVCGEEGVCVDDWTSHHCECEAGKTGSNCQQEEQAVGFGANTVVMYTLSESYKRKVALQAVNGATSVGRRKRQTGDSSLASISLMFRTKNSGGLLVHASTGSIILRVGMDGGRVRCDLDSETLTPSGSYDDSEWHNLTVSLQDGSFACAVGSSRETGTRVVQVPAFGLWETLQLGRGGEEDFGDFEGCMNEVLVNGEHLPLSGHSDMYTIEARDASGSCSGFGGPNGNGDSSNASTKIVVIVFCTFFGIAIIAVLSVLLFIRMRRKLKEKQGMPPLTTANGFSKTTNGDIVSKTKGSAQPSTGKHSTHRGGLNGETMVYSSEESNRSGDEFIIQQHIQDELNQRNFQEREVRASGTSLHSTRPDIIVQDKNHRRASPEHDLVAAEEPPGMDNMGYLEEEAERYDLDNASSIAPSDVYDFAAHYRQFRKNPAHNKFGKAKPHMHQRATPSPSNMLSSARDRQSPASMSVQRQSPASMLDRESPLIVGRVNPYVKPSQLTVENVNQLNRQTPVNQLSRASPAPNIPPPRGGVISAGVPTSLRSTPLSGIQGLYPSNISTSSVSDRHSMPNGHHRPGSRPSSKHKQPINQMGVRNTPTKGLTIEEVNRLNARFQSQLSTLDAVSSSSEDLAKNDINRIDFTHSDLLDPSAMLPPESSSEDDTNDSFTCSEFESDHEKIRNDMHHHGSGMGGGRMFATLPAVNEHDDTDTTTASRSRGGGPGGGFETESHSTFFTASEDELPKRIGRTKLPNGALSLDCMLNWGPNYERLVGVFTDIASLPQDEGSLSSSRTSTKQPSRPNSNQSATNRPASRHSQSPRPPALPPKTIDTHHSRGGSHSSLASSHGRAHIPTPPLSQSSSPVPSLPPGPPPTGHHISPSPIAQSINQSPLFHTPNQSNSHLRQSSLGNPSVGSGSRNASPVAPSGLLNGHVKQTSLGSIASSHDHQSSISSVHSSRSGVGAGPASANSAKPYTISPLANGLNVTQHLVANGGLSNGHHAGPLPAGLGYHSRSSSKSSTVSSRQPSLESGVGSHYSGVHPTPITTFRSSPAPEKTQPNKEEYV